MQYPWMGPAPQPQYQQPFQPVASPWGPYGQMQPQPQPDPGQIEGVRWVSTMDEVNGTTLGFGQSALFMFTGESAFAIKAVSSSGVPSVKVFDFEERKPKADPAYVTREEFEKLKEQVNAQPAVQQPASPQPQPAPTQLGADDPVLPGDSGVGQAAVLQPGGPNGLDPFPAQ